MGVPLLAQQRLALKAAESFFFKCVIPAVIDHTGGGAPRRSRPTRSGLHGFIRREIIETPGRWVSREVGDDRGSWGGE